MNLFNIEYCIINLDAIDSIYKDVSDLKINFKYNDNKSGFAFFKTKEELEKTYNELLDLCINKKNNLTKDCGTCKNFNLKDDQFPCRDCKTYMPFGKKNYWEAK